MNNYLADSSEETAPLVFNENKLSFMIGMGNVHRDKFYNDKKYGNFKVIQVLRTENN